MVQTANFYAGAGFASAKLAARQTDLSPLGSCLGQNIVMLRRLLILFIFFLCLPQSWAVDFDPLLDTAERYVRMQTQGLPGKVNITLGKVDVSRLPPCSAHEAYAPPGTRMSGKTHVAVRCLGPNIWSVLIPVQISVTGTYVSTARPLTAGQVITPGDLITSTGDLESLPPGVVNEASAAIGKTVRNSLAAGQPLRSNQLIAPIVIRLGQTVRVISQGNGFMVSSEGKALTNAAEGEIVQIRMASGQTVSGRAKSDGSIEISF